MRDDDGGGVVAANFGAQQVENLQRGIRIKIAGRLVRQQQSRAMGKSMAIATRCISPPESSRGNETRLSLRPIAASMSATRAVILSSVQRFSRSGSAMFSNTFKYGSK